MAADVKPRIRAPQTAKKDEVIEIKTLIQHQMESGQRRDSAGKIIPRSIINKFTCTYNGKMVVEMILEPAISANPAINFFIKCTESGKIDFAWHDDDGSIYKLSHDIAVS